MSAAATAAGYLYASGRLRGRGQKEAHEGERSAGSESGNEAAKEKRRVAHAPRREVRVAVYDQRADEPREPRQDAAPAHAPKRTPKIQYRTRRWKPDAPSE